MEIWPGSCTGAILDALDTRQNYLQAKIMLLLASEMMYFCVRPGRGAAGRAPQQEGGGEGRAEQGRRRRTC